MRVLHHEPCSNFFLYPGSVSELLVKNNSNIVDYDYRKKLWYWVTVTAREYPVSHTTSYAVTYSILYSRGRQPMARGPNVALFKKIMALFKFWGANKSHQKNLEKWLKNTSWWPSTKKVYNFSIFCPTYHKRLATPAIQYTLYNIQSDLYYPRNSIIRSFWGQNLVRPTYMKCGQTSIIRTSFIRGFWDQNLVRQSTADNRGLTVHILNT